MGLCGMGRMALASIAALAAAQFEPCPLILAPSDVAGGGLGVYSGRDAPKGKEAYEICPSIAVPNAGVHGTLLQHYIFGFNDTHSTLSFGLAMMYNHSPEPHLQNQWTTPAEKKNAPLAGGPLDVAFRPIHRPISKYEEVFDSYGTEQWFEEKGIDFKDHRPIDATAFARPAGALPGCGGSDVDVRDWVALASKAYAAGDIVEVAPGLVLEASRFRATLLDRFLAPLDEHLSFFLLGKGAIYVGDDNARGDEPNVDMHFYPDAALTPIHVAADHRSTKTDQSSHLVAVRATRPIMPGDKLTLDRAASSFPFGRLNRGEL